jgi:hypothetical protein
MSTHDPSDGWKPSTKSEKTRMRPSGCVLNTNACCVSGLGVAARAEFERESLKPGNHIFQLQGLKLRRFQALCVNCIQPCTAPTPAGRTTSSSLHPPSEARRGDLRAWTPAAAPWGECRARRTRQPPRCGAPSGSPGCRRYKLRVCQSKGLRPRIHFIGARVENQARSSKG